ncbi:MAG: hypothetical protein HY709_01700, partial [Candidatus Latescibacteria bacterium]|nr:hypothetical protein [Candidatus Latescibacterota bacterium]
MDAERLTLSNDLIEAVLRVKPAPGLLEIVDEQSGHRLACREDRLCTLRLSSGVPRIEIPNWQFHPGSGNAVPPEHEFGYLNGFYRPDLDTSNWIGAQRLNAYPIGPPC